LREPEERGILTRKVMVTSPPSVDAMTELGLEFMPVIRLIARLVSV